VHSCGHGLPLLTDAGPLCTDFFTHQEELGEGIADRARGHCLPRRVARARGRLSRIRWALRLTGLLDRAGVLPPPPCRCILGSRRALDAMLPLPIGASIEIQRIDGHVSIHSLSRLPVRQSMGMQSDCAPILSYILAAPSCECRFCPRVQKLATGLRAPSVQN
jgi:hypothetical protein